MVAWFETSQSCISLSTLALGMWTMETEHDGNPEAADDWDAAIIDIPSALWLFGIRTVEEA